MRNSSGDLGDSYSVHAVRISGLPLVGYPSKGSRCKIMLDARAPEWSLMIKAIPIVHTRVCRVKNSRRGLIYQSTAPNRKGISIHLQHPITWPLLLMYAN